MSDSPPYGLTCIVYGDAKVGKSWLGDTVPAPRLVLDAEGGSRFTPSRKRMWDPLHEEPPQYDGTWTTVFVSVTEYATVERVYQWLNSGQHPFRSVVMDSVSEVQQRVIDATAGHKQLDQQGWGVLLRTVSEMVRQFRDLTVHKIKPLDAVVLIAMENDPGLGQKIRPHMQGQIKTTLPYYVDLCARLFEVPTESGGYVRRLQFAHLPGYVVGERVGGCLGDFQDNPDLSTIIESIRGFVARTQLGEMDGAQDSPPDGAPVG